MSPDKENKPTLEQMLIALTDDQRNGRLSDELIARLEQALETSREAREVYRQHIEMHTLLLFGAPSTADQIPKMDSAESFAGFVRTASDQSSWQEQLENSDCAHTRAYSDSPGLSCPILGDDASVFLKRVRAPFGSSPLHGPILRCVAYVTASILLVAAIAFWGIHSNRRQANERIVSGAGFSQPGTSSLMNGGVVRVESGATRIRLPHVGFVDVDGPAELELIDPMRMRLDEGRIKMRVTEQSGHGYVVATPHGEVIDLGTEFGIDVTDVAATELVVFEGAVDLRMTGASLSNPTIERLTSGEGVRFGRNGSLDRIMSVNTGLGATFQRSIDLAEQDEPPVILSVSDDIRRNETKRFYGIVHGGLKEDAQAFLDRVYEWNGLDESGIPPFLLGADYVQTFNSYKMKPFHITLTLGRPADLYILWDMRVPPTDWLQRDFEKTEFQIGLDHVTNKQYGYVLGKGPGDKVDYPFSIWRMRVLKLRPITLGSLHQKVRESCVYGIAAVAIDENQDISTKQ